jgi:hypothetical protein
MRYPSKKDWWIVLIVAFTGVMLVGAAINQIASRGMDHPATWTLIGTALCYIAILHIFTYPIYYEVTDRDLIIRSGLIRQTIPLSSIDEAKPTRNPLSAPAWSLDRLHIGYRKKGKISFVLISPANRNSFLRELVRKSSDLELDGDTVVRSRQSSPFK